MFKLNYLLLIFVFFTKSISAQDTPIAKGKQAINKAIELHEGLISKIFLFISVLFIAYLLLRMLTSLIEKIAENRPSLRLHVKRYIPIINIFSWVLIIVFGTKAIINPSFQTLLAFGASAGIAIGLAVQDILKNIFGGVVLLIESPFSVGDKIQINEHYGEVVYIGLRSIRLQTPSDSMVTVPNSEFLYKSVSNANSGKPYCQVLTEFYLPITTPIKETKQLLTEVAMVSKYCNVNLPIGVVIANISQNGRSLLKFTVKAYVLDIREEFKFITDVTERVFEKLKL